MIESQDNSFDTLKLKVKKIVDLYEKEKEKNGILLREKQDLTESYRVAEQKLKDLVNKYNKLKLAKIFIASSNDMHDAKLKVNRMMREIDRCIALLNR
jgi:hypothetical protein